MSITVQHVKECLCLAHIYALGGLAGLNFSARTTFDYGVDGEFKFVTIRGNRRVDSGFGLAYQAKASVSWFEDDGHIVYDLEAKTYNDIVSRSEEETTLILILLCLPTVTADWHSISADATTLRNGCYWFLPEDRAVVPNQASKRIRIPLDHLLTSDSLLDLMYWERRRRLG